MKSNRTLLWMFLFIISLTPLFSQGVTTAALSGTVTDSDGEQLPNANVIAIHEASGTRYGAATRLNGNFNIMNMKVGGPYTITVSFIGYQPSKVENVYLSLGQNSKYNFVLNVESIAVGEVVISATKEDLFNENKTGAATFVNADQIKALPTVKRSTRDLTRLDPRSDGNFSFGGKNWLFNSISLDGSYFNNAFGLDDPAPGGQTGAEPVPFDAVEQVQVSIAPFDVREGGFTGAGINTVTKSGTNKYKASIYSFMRNESMLGNKVSGEKVIANPDLSFNQSGFTISGPIIKNKLFFFLNAEMERRDDPATNFTADTDGSIGFGESRVTVETMDRIRNRMIDEYGYDPGPYQGYVHETDNEKFLLKLDWNINDNNAMSFRYNYLDASRDQPPHPFVLSYNGSGRGPNESSIPFKSAGYKMNNELQSFALELNSNYKKFSNRFFFSYNRFRDYREPNSPIEFPHIQIGENGVTYTTLGSEPFSSHNILDQDVLQITNNFSYYLDDHILTVGGTFEKYSFYNSFNIFRNGLFMLPYFLDFEGDGIPNGSTFFTLEDFFRETEGGKLKLAEMAGTGPWKGEDINVAQLAFYVQDEWLINPDFTLTYGLRADIPIYLDDLVDNPFSRGLTLLDENDKPETVDQSKMPDPKLLFSPRVGFNWDVHGDESLKVRGGTGIFTGRIPFVWIGNNISNPGQNQNLPAHLRSFDLNAMVDDFSWPQVWNTNLAFDHILPGGLIGTAEFIYGKDLNSIYVRNADLPKPTKTLSDGRPYYKDADGVYELNPDGDAGAYIIDNTDKGYNFNMTLQLKKYFDFGLMANLAYSYTKAENTMKSTEIASVLWAENPTTGDPNIPELSFSEFGQAHRIIGGATYKHEWSKNTATTIGIFFEIAEGNTFGGAGGNRYSFTYAGDVNGDGKSGNDLIYIPTTKSEINFKPYEDANGNTVSASAQWDAFNAFIEQDDYLKENRGKIAERFGAVNPWYTNIDLKIAQDFSLYFGERRHNFQLSIDILNFGNMINSDWGVRKFARASATSPLQLVEDNNGVQKFNFNVNTKKTFVDDPGLFSRWQMQIGIRYSFE